MDGAPSLAVALRAFRGGAGEHAGWAGGGRRRMLDVMGQGEAAARRGASQQHVPTQLAIASRLQPCLHCSPRRVLEFTAK